MYQSSQYCCRKGHQLTLAVELFFAGMFAIRADHDFVVQEDFMKAVRKVADSKKLESKLDYKPV